MFWFNKINGPNFIILMMKLTYPGWIFKSQWTRRVSRPVCLELCCLNLGARSWPFLVGCFLPFCLGACFHFVSLSFFLCFFMGLSPLCLQWNLCSFRANGHWISSTPHLHAQIVCLQETLLNSSDSVTFWHMTVYKADRLLSRGGGLLTAVNISMPSFLIQLPSCADPSFEALGVAVFFDNI